MQLESLNCNNCGAPLEVAATSNFVTCNHCSTRLAVRRTESSAFTEQLEDIGAKQDEMLNRLKRIERQTQLSDLDREWESNLWSQINMAKHICHPTRELSCQGSWRYLDYFGRSWQDLFFRQWPCLESSLWGSRSTVASVVIEGCKPMKMPVRGISRKSGN